MVTNLLRHNVAHRQEWSGIRSGGAQLVGKRQSIPIIVIQKPGAKANRKHQPQQPKFQSVSSPPFTLGGGGARKTPKPGKNSTGKSGKNSRTTTARPFLLSTLNGYEKSRKYDLSGYLESLRMTTPRPTKLVFANNLDTFDKIPANKAPKQVKQEYAPISNHPSTLAPDALWVDPNASNPNIPKLFQRYEKIQEVYPEFHPYVGPVKSSTRTPYGAASYSGSSALSTSHGKPSRENSKSLFFTDNNQLAGTSILASLTQQIRNSSSRILAKSSGKG